MEMDRRKTKQNKNNPNTKTQIELQRVQRRLRTAEHSPPQILAAGLLSFQMFMDCCQNKGFAACG